MKKIFYNKETLQIMGMSDGDNSLELPYVETDLKLHSLTNFEIQRDGEDVKLVCVKGYYEDLNNN